MEKIMKPEARKYGKEDDYWQVRQFLREVFLLNGHREHSWHVARWDYLQWHMIATCKAAPSLEDITTLWETPDGRIAAVMNCLDPDEAFLHVHPAFRTPQLEQEMIQHAERTFSNVRPDGARRLYVPVDEDDSLRKDILGKLGYAGVGNLGFEHYRDLDTLPEAAVPAGYTIRSMGDTTEHGARSWASWQAFHPSEADSNFDPDPSWVQNLQRAPLYRRDLDIVAATAEGGIAAFCTIYYDDATRSAVTVLVGTATPHQRRGLGKAVIAEGMRRLQRMGCRRVFAKAFDATADALYNSVMPVRLISETWIKDYK